MNTVLKRYNSFNREILAEVLAEKDLEMLDKLYNKAKIIRLINKYNKAVDDCALTKDK